MVGLGHDGALAAATTGDERYHAPGAAGKHAEQALNLAHCRTAPCLCS
jgi:hypothetical protein